MKNKKIIINNENDYNKFLRKLFLYKRFIYFNTLFVVDSKIKDPMIDGIITALNIKKRKKRIEYIYDFCCSFIDDKNKGKNICGFTNNKCYIQIKKNDGKCNGCCRRCMYQSCKGCITKNLACKLFNCSEVKTRYEVVKYEDLKILKLFSIENRYIVINDYFSKREDVLKDLYSYSFVYSFFRMFSRLIINHFKMKKKSKK